ncbi:Cytochrome P450 [Macleaya cordata]|uniref:Cytochrome P450 n=1 Tax=Macleaya cordata TaxID=56857 RepID=A0A200Q331_MACCD|nr:Cytochrome P450 [Macleaya cordata]
MAAGFGLILVILVSISFSFYLLLCLTKFLYKVWFNPIHIQSVFSSQGVKGPPYRFYHGNTKEIFQMRKESMNRPMELSLHDSFSKIQPHLHSWIRLYGKTFLTWYGTRAQLIVTEPDLIKQILNNRDGTFTKRKIDGDIKKIFGEGLVTNRGEKWAKSRKLADHAFHAESLKGLVPTMITEVEIMLERWKHHEGKEIDVSKEFRLLTAEVISRTAFGSNYVEGKNIFEILMKLISIFSRNFNKLKFPGIRTRDDIESDKLEEEMRNSILKIIKKREERMKMGDLDGYGNDFLGLLIKANHEEDESKRITTQDMIDECKTFYNAGHETSTSLLVWACLLLAFHTDWQDKARKEVMDQLQGQKIPIPYDNCLARLKTMNMILHESLRLYPPVVNIMRIATREVKLGEVFVPPNTEVVIPPLAPHYDPEVWGEDVQLFKPERFSEGVMKATNGKLGFVAFSSGPRICAGLNFAMNEAKIALTMILQRYSFSLSPSYVHSPIQGLSSCPQYGVQIILHPFVGLILTFLVVSTSFSLYLLLCLTKFLYKVWFNPIHIQSVLSSQGIKGPPYRFYHGNTKQVFNMRREIMSRPMEYLSHDIFPKMQPHIHSWIKLYGQNFLTWFGTRPQLIVTDPDLIKEVLNNRDGMFTKRKADGYIKKMFGDGLVMTQGEKWARQRKLANQKLEGKIAIITIFSIHNCIDPTKSYYKSFETMLERWKHQEGKEIEVFKEFKLLTSEVISRTAFGSNYLEGKNIFEMLAKLSSMFSTNYSTITGFRTRDEIESDKLDEEIRKSILKIIRRREEKIEMGELDDYGSDYLGLLIKANHESDESKRITLEDMIDECKTLYISGHETTTSLLVWTCLLPAIHTDWQDKARKEVIDHLNGEKNPNPDDNCLARLKTMNMIINETLRLYPPVVMAFRIVEREARLGEIILPPNTEVIIPTLAPHHDLEIWGEDVQLFKPERFSDGVMKATNNKPGFLPFGSGPRICVGMNFAMNEAKIALTMILQRYSFTLSPAYVHSPMHGLTNFPQHGVQIIFNPL